MATALVTLQQIALQLNVAIESITVAHIAQALGINTEDVLSCRSWKVDAKGLSVPESGTTYPTMTEMCKARIANPAKLERNVDRRGNVTVYDASEMRFQATVHPIVLARVEEIVAKNGCTLFATADMAKRNEFFLKIRGIERHASELA